MEMTKTNTHICLAIDGVEFLKINTSSLLTESVNSVDHFKLNALAAKVATEINFDPSDYVDKASRIKPSLCNIKLKEVTELAKIKDIEFSSFLARLFPVNTEYHFTQNGLKYSIKDSSVLENLSNVLGVRMRVGDTIKVGDDAKTILVREVDEKGMSSVIHLDELTIEELLLIFYVLN